MGDLPFAFLGGSMKSLRSLGTGPVNFFDALEVGSFGIVVAPF